MEAPFVQVEAARDQLAAATVSPGDDTALLLEACRLVGGASGVCVESVESTVPPQAPAPLRERVARIAARSRARHRWVTLRNDWWRRDNGPLLAFRAGPDESRQAPVALLPASPTRYALVEPATGERALVDESVARTLDGRAVMFYPSLPAGAVTLRETLAVAVRGSTSDLRMVLAAGACGGVVALSTPLLLAQLIGKVIPSSDRGLLAQTVLAMAVAALSGAGFQITRSIALLRLSGRLDAAFQAAVWDRVIALPVPFFSRYSAGELADRATGIEEISELLSGPGVSSLIAAVFSLFSVALLFYYDWRLAAVATALVGVLTAGVALTSYLQLRHQRDLSRLRGAVASLLFDLIQGIGKVRLGGAERRAYRRWAVAFGQQRRASVAAKKLANLQSAGTASFGLVSTMTLFTMVLVAGPQTLTTSDLLAFFAAFGQFVSAALSLIALLPTVLAAVPKCERLRPILTAATERARSGVPLAGVAGGIAFEGVSFRYDAGSPLALENVSFSIQPGECVALVGPSGAGKSTCLRLILGFHEPEAGAILFDGRDASGLDILSLRRHMGVVLQGSQPMAGDIYSNIVGSRHAMLDDAWEAARLAGLDEDIRALPMGMATIVSDTGSTFSGGQLQRLAIARAMVHRPRIMLLDEATSALDNLTQACVMRSLERLDATRVIVAHRLSTIQRADRIIVFDRGRIVETGTYDELVSARKLFAALVARQVA